MNDDNLIKPDSDNLAGEAQEKIAPYYMDLDIPIEDMITVQSDFLKVLENAMFNSKGSVMSDWNRDGISAVFRVGGIGLKPEEFSNDYTRRFFQQIQEHVQDGDESALVDLMELDGGVGNIVVEVLSSGSLSVSIIGSPNSWEDIELAKKEFPKGVMGKNLENLKIRIDNDDRLAVSDIDAYMVNSSQKGKTSMKAPPTSSTLSNDPANKETYNLSKIIGDNFRQKVRDVGLFPNGNPQKMRLQDLPNHIPNNKTVILDIGEDRTLVLTPQTGTSS